MIQLRNTIFIIAGIVVIASLSYLSYVIYNSDLRKKELDKKANDVLDQQKEINNLLREKLQKSEVFGISPLKDKIGYEFSVNGNKKKKKVKLEKAK